MFEPAANVNRQTPKQSGGDLKNTNNFMGTVVEDNGCIDNETKHWVSVRIRNNAV